MRLTISWVRETLSRATVLAGLSGLQIAFAAAAMAQPEPAVVDLDSADVEVKGYISDLDAARMASQPQPSLELPPSAEPVPSVAEPQPPPARKPAEPARKSPSSSDLSRRKPPAEAKAPAKKTETAVARPQQSSPAKSSPAKVTAKPDSAKKAEVAQPAAPKKSGKTASKEPAKAVASSSVKPSRTVSRPSSAASRTLGPGELTVTRADGSVASLRPPGRSPVGSLSHASRVSETVKGRVASVTFRPDGRARVMLINSRHELVQVIVPEGQSALRLEPGEQVSLNGERVGGSASRPVIELSEFGPGPAFAPGPYMIPHGSPYGMMPYGPQPFSPYGPPPGW